jgi:hypothetical protein
MTGALLLRYLQWDQSICGTLSAFLVFHAAEARDEACCEEFLLLHALYSSGSLPP